MMEFEIDDLIDFKVDLSKIDDDELESLASLFERYEKEFKDDWPELDFTFQRIREILRSETIARQAGLASEGPLRFYLPPKEVFRLPALMNLTMIACRIADSITSRREFGLALLMAILYVDSGIIEE